MTKSLAETLAPLKAWWSDRKNAPRRRFHDFGAFVLGNFEGGDRNVVTTDQLDAICALADQPPQLSDAGEA